MTTETLILAWRSFNQRKPFQRYYVEFVSGDRIVAIHPEAIRDYGDLFLFRAPNRSHRVFDALSVCQILDREEGHS
jgi:hypothetical protein